MIKIILGLAGPYKGYIQFIRLARRFWLAVQDLKKRPIREVPARVQEIWQEFLAPGAPSAINVDSKSYDKTTQNVKDPGRYAFEDAQVTLAVEMHETAADNINVHFILHWGECCRWSAQWIHHVTESRSSYLFLITLITTGTHLQINEEWFLQPLHTLQCLPGVITGQKEGKTLFRYQPCLQLNHTHLFWNQWLHLDSPLKTWCLFLLSGRDISDHKKILLNPLKSSAK